MNYAETSMQRAELESFGFRFGSVGTHARRTMMYKDLELLLSSESTTTDLDFFAKVTNDNVLAKTTASARRDAYQHLRELYGLSDEVPIFRLLFKFWKANPMGRRLLALMCALARDPILRASQLNILETEIGNVLDRSALEETIMSAFPGRFNTTTLASVGRNIASSWTQSGHLVGSTRKTRTKPQTTPENTTFALLLSFITGSRGLSLLRSPWTQLLDIDRHELVGRMEDAARLGLVNIRQSASILEVRFDSLLTKREMEIVYGGY